VGILRVRRTSREFFNNFFFLKGFTGVLSKEEFQLKIHGKFLQEKKKPKKTKLKKKIILEKQQ
jgi:hypothetical protein